MKDLYEGASEVEDLDGVKKTEHGVQLQLYLPSCHILPCPALPPLQRDVEVGVGEVQAQKLRRPPQAF